jgi:hypothetical protein
MRTGTDVGLPLWRDSPHICALADSERHFGHIVKEDQWIAYDATHSASCGEGMLRVGRFPTPEMAKEAVERSVAVEETAHYRSNTASCQSVH